MKHSTPLYAVIAACLVAFTLSAEAQGDKGKSKTDKVVPLVVVAGLPLAPGQTAADLADKKSQDQGDVKVTLTVTNAAGAPIHVNWIDWDGKEKEIFDPIPAGQRMEDATTSLGHFFRARDARTNALLQEFRIKNTGGKFDITITGAATNTGKSKTEKVVDTAVKIIDALVGDKTKRGQDAPAGLGRPPSGGGLMTITSTTFAPNSVLPRYTASDPEGQNVSPALIWGAVPPTARELALVCHDPDAPDGDWVHWVVYGIPAGPGQVAEGQLLRGTQGVNDWNEKGWDGPLPPEGDPYHRYIFTLYALNRPLKLPAGLNRKQLLKAINSSVVAQAAVQGFYKIGGGTGVAAAVPAVQGRPTVVGMPLVVVAGKPPAAAAAPVLARGQTAADLADKKSQDQGDAEVMLTVTNAAGAPIRVNWVDLDGKEEEIFGPIPAGQRMDDATTYLGHFFRARDVRTNALLQEFRIKNTGGKFDITITGK